MSARVVAFARAWIGTPYRHQASVKGVGADCLGLIRGLWREVVGPEPAPVPPYSPDWAEVGGAETLLEAARAWLVEVHPAQARPGDVLVFRMSRGAPAKHCGVLSCAGVDLCPSGLAAVSPRRGERPRRMVHAYWGRAVVESWMGRFWEERLVAAFRWPSRPGLDGDVGSLAGMTRR